MRRLTADRQFYTKPGRLGEPFVLNSPILSWAYKFDLRESGQIDSELGKWMYSFSTYIVALHKRRDELVDLEVGKVLS